MYTDNQGNEYYMLRDPSGKHRCMYFISAAANKEHTTVIEEGHPCDFGKHSETLHTHDARKHWTEKVGKGWEMKQISIKDLDDIKVVIPQMSHPSLHTEQQA